MAICAKEVKKPFYVLTESFKFSRIYPLNQVDLPDEFKVNYRTLAHQVISKIFAFLLLFFNLKSIEFFKSNIKQLIKTKNIYKKTADF
jgi:translation initiation factor 2B subunit (eIF-2B alpha/beta/delta family)